MRLSDPWDPTWLSTRRRELGLTQAQVAARAGGGCSQAWISRWEKAGSQGPGPVPRMRLAMALGEVVEQEPDDTISRLRMARKLQGISQEALAQRLGVSRSYVSAWERGTRRPRPELLDAWRGVVLPAEPPAT